MLKDFFDYIEGKEVNEEVPDYAKVVNVECGFYGDTIYYKDGSKDYIGSIDTH
jgi:hypothetical protein